MIGRSSGARLRNDSAARRALGLVAGIAGVLALALTASISSKAITAAPNAPDEASAAVIARYQARIPELMTEQGIPGLAVAIVDANEVLWAEAFGVLERGRATRLRRTRPSASSPCRSCSPQRRS